MDLTPELFETTEFAERRKGYDIEQVETFMEEAGTALAQMLARVRHTEERAAQAEAKLAQADAAIAGAEQRARAAEQRVEAAEAAAREATANASANAAAAENARLHEEAEVEQAAKTLLMAKRTAEATVNEARGQAQSLLEDSQSRAQRLVNEAHAEAEELVRRANEQAEAEYADRRAAVAEEVQTLELRRSQTADVITQLEARLAGYREELERAAAELVELAADPSRLGARPTMSLHPDEVLAPGEVEPAGEADRDPAPAHPEPDDRGEPAVGGADVAVEEVEDVGDVEEVAAPGTTEGRVEDHRPGSTGGEASASVAAADGGSGSVVVTSSPSVMVDGDVVDLTRPPEQDRTGSANASVSGDAIADAVAEAGSRSVDDPGEPTEQWAPGSWAELEARMADAQDAQEEDGADAPAPAPQVDRPTEAVDYGTSRDRFMEELDSAVNEAVEMDDDAMRAFFEGPSETRSRRFGWRR